jgi:membrane dipeptidase
MKFQTPIIILSVLIALIILFEDHIGKDKTTDDKQNTMDSIGAEETLNPLDLLPPEKKQITNYMDLHYDAIIVDTHNDFIWQVYNKGANFGKRNSFTHTDKFKLKEGGVDVQVYAVWIPMSEVKRSYNFTVNQIDRLKKFQQDHPEDIEFANSYNDIIRIVDEKKICGIIGIEGGTAIENDLNNINKFFDMGVRYIGLTWNNSNKIASSARDETERGKKGGLTNFGYTVIERMDEVGMIIDVAHLGEASFWDVIRTTKNPVITSHSNVYTLNPHFRNLTDDQIKAIAKTGGVVQLSFNQSFIDKNAARTGAVGIDMLIQHIDYVKNLVGVDYVGLGSDYDGGITPPIELYDVTQLPLLTKKLMEKNYTEEEIRKILGLNFLRVYKQVCG